MASCPVIYDYVLDPDHYDGSFSLLGAEAKVFFRNVEFGRSLAVVGLLRATLRRHLHPPPVSDPFGCLVPGAETATATIEEGTRIGDIIGGQGERLGGRGHSLRNEHGRLPAHPGSARLPREIHRKAEEERPADCPHPGEDDGSCTDGDRQGAEGIQSAVEGVEQGRGDAAGGGEEEPGEEGQQGEEEESRETANPLQEHGKVQAQKWTEAIVTVSCLSLLPSNHSHFRQKTAKSESLHEAATKPSTEQASVTKKTQPDEVLVSDRTQESEQ